jgi:hypothetical protein
MRTKKLVAVCVAATLPLLTGCLESVGLLLTHPAEAQAVLDGHASTVIGGLTSWAVWADPYLQMLSGVFGGG